MMAWWLSPALAGPVLGELGSADAFSRCVAAADAEAGLSDVSDQAPERPAIAQPVGELPPSDKIAVVVGVPCHRSEQIPSLQYSTRDAALVGDRLASAGFTVLSLVSAVDRRQLFEALERAEKALSPDGTLVVYFSGHGTLREEGGELRRYLVLSDTDLGSVHTTGIAVRALEERVARISAQTRVVIQDTCFADRPAAGNERGKGLLPIESGLQLQPGDLRLYGSRFFEQAVESVALRGSIYTVYLLEALDQDRADLDGDGCVGLVEAHAWARDKVVTERAGSQVPQVRVMRSQRPGTSPRERTSSLTLSCEPAGPQRAVLAAPVDGGWSIEVRDSEGQAIEGPALVPGRYRFIVTELVPTDTGEIARETRLRGALGVRAGQWVDVIAQLQQRRARQWVELTAGASISRDLHPASFGVRAGLAPADHGQGRLLLGAGAAFRPGFEPAPRPETTPTSPVETQPIAFRAVELSYSLGYLRTLVMPGHRALLLGPVLSGGPLWRTSYNPQDPSVRLYTYPGGFGELGLRALYDHGPVMMSLEAGARFLPLGLDDQIRVGVIPALSFGLGRGL